MKVTSIEVFYARKVQPQAYESADCSIKVGLSFEEDAPDIDAAMRGALDQVQGLVHERLGIATAKKPLGRPKLPEDPAVAENLAANKAAKAEKIAAAEAKAEERPAEVEAPKEISNDDLNKAMVAKMAELRNKGDAGRGVRITALVEKYLPDGEKKPAQAARLPQSQRAAFLAELNAMAPA